MKNTTEYIGKRIRDLRLNKNLTQNQLCGDELTRNHLSLIESGKSLPSLKNICYIADRLDVPVGYFFSADENEDAHFVNYLAVSEIKKSFTEGDHLKCISLCAMLPDDLREDEISMLYSKALFHASLASAEKDNISTAVSLMDKAADTAVSCSYLGDDFIRATEYYKVSFTSLSAHLPPEKLTDLREISSFVPAELVVYMRLLSGIMTSSDFFTTGFHADHAKAIRYMEDGNTQAAYELLLILSESPTLPYYMKFRVFDDLEKCANITGEFKTAYTAARRKLEMLGKY